jgi:serine/threonine protein kinase/formylglycine-generating enzyme required for sulfatase activity
MNTDDQDRSLGDAATFAGSSKRRSEDASLGDERTLGGGDAAGIDTVFDDIEVVDLAARYKTEGTLGRGGMGEVLLAVDTRLDRKVAIKRILGEAARSKTAVSRFLTEAKAIAALNHPNVVQIYDYGRAADGPFLIMEYVDGSSLLDRCRDGALPLEQAVDLACQLCDGLAKAHDLGIVHRDIKPANVLLTKDGLPKLTDFGLAKAEVADHGQTMTGAVLGTPDFMPPEQRRDASLVDARSDLWSLAATVYQMVTGKSPKIIRFKDVPETIQEVLGKALEDDKDARYQTVREFRDALKASLRAAATAAPIELGDGQCPSCGVKNDSSRKFCRGCGESLEAPCLSCGKGMPYWEEICGQCGTKQDALLTQRREAMAEVQSKAEALLNDLDFQGAEAAANALRDEPDLRLKHLVDWAKSFLPKIEKSREEQRNRAVLLATEAMRHEQAFDYASAIHALEQVPASLGRMALPGSADSVDAAISRLTAKQAECQRLEARIKSAIAARELAGLMPDVESLLRLRPDRDDVQKIKSQLLERHENLVAQRDAAITKARQLLTKHEYSNAVAALSGVDRSVITAEFTAVLEQAEGLLRKVQHLRAKIKQAVADKRLDGLLPEVESLLELVPGNAEAPKLQESLAAREAKVAADVAAIRSHAEDAWQGCRFGKVKELLSRIPDSHRTAIEVARIDETADLALWQDAASNAVANATDYDGTMRAVSQSKQYLAMLEGHSLRDAAALSALSHCETLRAKYEAEQAQAEKLGRRMRHAIFAAVTVATLVAIGGAGVWIRGAIRRAEIARALEQKRWDDVIAMDATIAAAYIGRAQQRLTSDADSAMRDLDEAERRGGLRDEIEAIRAQVYAARAAVYASAGRLADAESDLQEVKRRNGDDVVATDAIARAWSTRAIDLASSGRITEAEAAVQRADALAQDDSGISVLKNEVATIWSNRIVELAYGGQIAMAEAELVKLQSFTSADTALGPVRISLAAAWLRKAQSALADKNASEAMAALNAARDHDAGYSNAKISPLLADALVLHARELLSRGESKAAMAAIADALQANCEVSTTALSESTDAELRQAVLSDHRDRFDLAVANDDWENALQIVDVAKALDATASKWIVESIAELSVAQLIKAPPAVLSVLPSEALAAVPPGKILEMPLVSNSIGVKMKLLPAGSFTSKGENVFLHEPPRAVTLRASFFIGVHEVTNSEWARVMGNMPSNWKDDERPVERVTWNEATEFCRQLSELPEERAAGRVYRLPTAAEWEYACRAGKTTSFPFGDLSSGADWQKLKPYAWFRVNELDNAGHQTHPVGQKKPNGWGLFDMHGNVAEWCSDQCGLPKRGDERVCKGGSWQLTGGGSGLGAGSAHCNRPSTREAWLGFRVAMVISRADPSKSSEDTAP